jgi:hypothetical protein
LTIGVYGDTIKATKANDTKEETIMAQDRMTPAQAWEGFVGSQTVADFMAYSRRNGRTTPAEAVTAYVADLSRMFPAENITADDQATIAPLLIAYIEANE